MTAPQRIGRASIGVFMAVTCALGMAGVAEAVVPASPVTPAAATHHKPPHHKPPKPHCPSKHKGHYPPGKCRIFFDRGHYHPGQTVKFVSGRVFKKHEKVSVTLTCHQGRYHKSYGTVKAHSNGTASDAIHLSSRLKGWGCTLTLKGQKSGVVLNGHISVQK